MPQLKFNVPERVADKLRAQAAAQKTSLSKYIASLVLNACSGDWPEGYFENAVGFWQGPTERPDEGSLETRGV